MRVKVERCWCGGDKFRFRATTPDGHRFAIPCKDGDDWSRRYAREMLDVLEDEGYKRSNVRFYVS
jgi:hypothetical protein